MHFCYPCAITVELTDNERCSWSASVLERQKKVFVITTLSPLLQGLTCKKLKLLHENSFHDLIYHIISASVSVKLQSSSFNSHSQFSVNFLMTWKSRKLAYELERIYRAPGIFCSEENSEESSSPCCSLHVDETFLSWFIIFTFVKEKQIMCHIPNSKNENSLYGCKIVQGMTVWTNSYPFHHSGLDVFQGCVSKGVVCNNFNDTIVLTDARCLPGAEGCVVYSSEFTVVGILVCCIELKCHQLAGLSLVCSIEEIEKSLHEQCYLQKQNNKIRNFLTTILTSNHDFDKLIQESTVVIDSKSNERLMSVEVVSLHHNKGWGSGVVVALDLTPFNTKMYIATCQHVIAPALNKSVQVRFKCGSKKRFCLPGYVVFATENSWLDFALLEVKCEYSDAVSMHSLMEPHLFNVKKNLFVLRCASDYIKGANVITKGHCLFESSDVPATVTKGVISNVIFRNQNLKKTVKPFPLLLHSNCIVLDGASGGGLFGAKSSIFYGLIVSNVKLFFEKEKFILYPQINFILPARVFMPSVLSHVCGSTSGFGDLRKLATNTDLGKYWLLSDKTQLASASKL